MHRWGHHRGIIKAAEDMHDRLDRFAALAKFNAEFEDAFEFFFSEPIDFLQEYVSEEEFTRFMDWFIHDYVLSDGCRLIQKYEEEHGSRLPRGVRRMLSTWMDAHLSLFEYRARREDAFELVDLLTGSTHIVSAQSLPEEIHPWSIIIGRPLSMGEIDYLAPSYTLLPPAVKATMIPLIRGEFGRARLKQSNVTAAEFLRQNGHLFYDFMMGLDEWIMRSVEQAMEAMTITCARAVFTLSDRDAVIHQLMEDDRISSSGVFRFILNDKPSRTGGKRVHAEIMLAKNRLHVTTVSFDSLQKAKETVNRICGDAVRHRLDVYEDRMLPQDTVLHDVVRKHQGSPLEKYRLIEAMKQMEYAKSAMQVSGGSEEWDGEWVNRSDVHPTKLHPFEVDKADFYMLGIYPDLWDDPKQKQVAESTAALLKQVYAADGEEQAGIVAAGNAFWMWWAFCAVAFPKVRKVDAWAAALYYCINYVEDKKITRKACAEVFDVSPTTVSNNVKRMMMHLRLAVYDDRYCIRYPFDDLFI